MKQLKYNICAVLIVCLFSVLSVSADNCIQQHYNDSVTYFGCDTMNNASNNIDSKANVSHYDRRIHNYRNGWGCLIPTQHVLQFCGNMGLFSIGIGWEYGKRRQWETHLLVGFVPKYESDYPKITLTLKQNYIPWSIYLDHGWSFEPLQCGMYANTVFGQDFWVKQPVRYAGGYYPFSTRIRPNIFVGERVTKIIPHNRRKYIKSLSFFYELSANDIGIMNFSINGKADFWDVFGLSLGLKAQLL